MDKNIEKWDQIYSQSKAGSFLSYPNENLVTLFFQNRESINQEGKCLDYGFGSGNNSEFLIQHMEELYGVEISDSCLDIANKRLQNFTNYKQANFMLEYQKGDFSNFFDLVVAWQMLCYNDKSTLTISINNLYNSLKKNGVLLCTLTTNRDVKTKYASKEGENTYVIDSRIPHQEGCKIYSPNNEHAFLELFSQFEIIDYGYFERASFLIENTASEFYLVAQKK